MVKDSDQVRQQMLTDALIHLQSAIKMLDGADAPGHIAGHVDLALCQLKELMARPHGLEFRRPGALDGGLQTALTS